MVSYLAIPVRACPSSMGARRAVTDTQREKRGGGRRGKATKGREKGESFTRLCRPLPLRSPGMFTATLLCMGTRARAWAWTLGAFAPKIAGVQTFLDGRCWPVDAYYVQRALEGILGRALQTREKERFQRVTTTGGRGGSVFSVCSRGL